jgi:hypothetical protein
MSFKGCLDSKSTARSKRARYRTNLAIHSSDVKRYKLLYQQALFLNYFFGFMINLKIFFTESLKNYGTGTLDTGLTVLLVSLEISTNGSNL